MSVKKKIDSAVPSSLLQLLGLDASQVRAELAASGVDPDEELRAMRRLGRVMAAKHAPQAERERQRDFAKPFPLFEELVAAGSPAWAGVAREGRESSILDVIAQGDPRSMMWARVSGWSMRDAGIKDGDVVLVDTKSEPKDGDIVLAHLAGLGQVVKRLRLAGAAHAYLDSANPDFEPIEVTDPGDLLIHGVVVGRAGKV